MIWKGWQIKDWRAAIRCQYSYWPALLARCSPFFRPQPSVLFHFRLHWLTQSAKYQHPLHQISLSPFSSRFLFRLFLTISSVNCCLRIRMPLLIFPNWESISWVRRWSPCPSRLTQAGTSFGPVSFFWVNSCLILSGSLQLLLHASLLLPIRQR